MASRKAKQKRAAVSGKKRPVVPEPETPSALAQYIVARQAIFSFASAILFMICIGVLAIRWPEAQLRYANTSPAVKWTFVGLWCVSAAYRIYHNRIANPRLKTIVLDDREIRLYSIRQTVSTLISLAFAIAALTYLLGYLDPAAVWLARELPTVDHQTLAIMVHLVIAVLTPILWNVVSSAIWDGMKWILWKKRRLRESGR